MSNNDPVQDLVAALVEQNVKDLAHTTDEIIAGKDAEIRALRWKLNDVLRTIERIPIHSRPVLLDNLLHMYSEE